MTIRVFDCPVKGRVAYLEKTPIEKIVAVSCDCFKTHLASEVNLRDEKGEL